MPQDEIKSLVNSVNMVKNMVESIVTAVQDRFKDYDNVVVSLKERIEKLETQPTISGQVPSGDTSALIAKIEQLGKRLDSLNERILLIEATKSVVEKPLPDTAKIDIVKADVGYIEESEDILDEIEPSMPTEPAVDIEPKVPMEPLVKEAPSMPVPSPPEHIRTDSAPIPKPTTEIPTPIPKPTTEIPTPIPKPTTEISAPIPKPTTEISAPIPKPMTDIPKPVTEISTPTPAAQVTEAPVERDVSPISKEVTGVIPIPPSQSDIPVPQHTAQVQPQIVRQDDSTPPEEGKSAELFGEAVSGDKAELLKALKKLEDL